MSNETANNNNADYGTDILTLVDDDGTSHEFELIDRIDIEDNEYFALIPIESPDNLSDDDGELIILKVVEEDGEEYLDPIDNDEEFDEVAEIFRDRLEEYYDIEDIEES